MKLIDYLDKENISYRWEGERIFVERNIFINPMRLMQLPDNLIIEGNLIIHNSSFNWPKKLTVKRHITIFEPLPISFPYDLNEGEKIYLSYHEYITYLPNNFKHKIFIYILNRGKWGIYINENEISIACKIKTADQWKEFFKNKRFYETDPQVQTEEYNCIEQDFLKAVEIQNKLFKS